MQSEALSRNKFNISLITWNYQKTNILITVCYTFQDHKLSENGNMYVGIQVVDSDTYWVWISKKNDLATVFRVKYSK